MTERTGGCLCGQVRFRLSAEPMAVRICWCADCRRMSSNGTVNAVVASDGVDVTGVMTEYTRAAQSGNQVSRRFCAVCGCHLFADSSARKGLTVVRVGTLDDPSSVQPSANIWSASAPSWASLDAALDRIEGQPASPRPQSSAG